MLNGWLEDIWTTESKSTVTDLPTVKEAIQRAIADGIVTTRFDMLLVFIERENGCCDRLFGSEQAYLETNFL